MSQYSQEITCFGVPTFNKVALVKKRLRHRCFPVHFENFLRTTFLQKSSGGCFSDMHKLLVVEKAGFKLSDARLSKWLCDTSNETLREWI